MTLLSIFSRRFLENPHVGRQLARFSPLALGSVLFLVTGGLLFADFLVFRNIFLEDSSWLGEGLAGSVLHLVNAQLLYGFLALLLPVRLAGAIDGARADRAFDQIVVTGWSPLGLHLGNWGLGLAHAGIILGVSLPFQAFAYTLGGVTLREIVTAYAVLAIYSNVIIATTLALAIGERERVVVPTSIFLFILAGVLCLFTPAGGVLGEATPIRFLVRQSEAGFFLYPHLLASSAANAPVVIFSWAMEADHYQFLLWALLLLPACIVLLLGPSHRFTPGLNNFGAVTLPGDRWRRLFRRQFLALARKVELAFFYENRPRWLDGWDFILRKLPIFAWLGLLWGIIQGHAFRGAPSIDPALRFFRDQPFLISIAGTAAFAFLALIALGDTRHRAGVRERIGRLELPRGLLLSAAAAVVLAGFFILHWRTLEVGLESARAASSVSVATGLRDLALAQLAAIDREARLHAYVEDWRRLMAAVLLFLLNCHLIAKLLSLLAGSMHALGFSLSAIACTLLFGPYFIWLGIDEGWLPSMLFPLIFLTPFVLPAMQDSDFSGVVTEMGFGPGDDFRWLVGLHLSLACIVLVILATLRWRRKRRSRRELSPARSSPVVATFLLGAVLLSSNAGGAEALPFDVRVIHGFEGRLLGEGVDFFTVVLKNASSRAIRGIIRTESGDPPEDLLPPRPFEAPALTTTVLRWSQVTHPGLDFSGARLLFEAPEGIFGVEMPEAVEVARQQQRGSPRELVYLVVSERSRLPALVRSDHKWVACKPLSLPEDPRAYEGASTVFIGSTDLPAWTKGQRDALHDYIRLGGSVVFYGPLDRASLQGVPEWSALLGGKRGSKVIRAGVELAEEEIEEGEIVWRLEGQDGEPAVPLLTVRAVGPGRLGHLAFDLASGPEVLGPRAGGAETFWSAFESRLPRSVYPAAVVVPSSGGAALLDPGPLFAVVFYFLFYMAFVGPGLALGFRRRSRRRWVLPYIAGVSILFVAAIPLLDLFIHSSPSYASVVRIAYFGPGARRGVVQGCLRVRSSGRQRHRVRIDAELPSAYFFAPGFDSRFRETERMSGEPGRLTAPLELNLPPWGNRRVVITGDASRAEPITGRVILDVGSGRGSLRASGLPRLEDGPGLRGRLLLFGAGGGTAQGFDLAAASFSPGEVTMDFPFPNAGATSLAVPGGSQSLSFQQGLAGSLTIASGAGPRAVLAFIAPDVPLSLESSDLAFEREVGPEPEPKKGSRRSQGARLIDRGGKLYRSFEGVLILQELPLEIR